MLSATHVPCALIMISFMDLIYIYISISFKCTKDNYCLLYKKKEVISGKEKVIELLLEDKKMSDSLTLLSYMYVYPRKDD